MQTSNVSISANTIGLGNSVATIKIDQIHSGVNESENLNHQSNPEDLRNATEKNEGKKTTQKKATGQTGPKSLAGKRKIKFNALKAGRYAKSPLLPFENARQYSKHCKEIFEALEPSNYIETQMVDEYANCTWRIQRHETCNIYKREKILEKLTPAMAASFLEVDDKRASHAPKFLTDLSYRISQKERQAAHKALVQYEHLLKNAKGINNFNLVWRQYLELFQALSHWIDARSVKVPLFSSTGQGLSMNWQQQPAKILECLELVSYELYYIAHWEIIRPQIRVWMESYYFLQRQEQYRLRQDEHLLIKERNYANGILDRLMRLRKSGILAVTSHPISTSH